MFARNRYVATRLEAGDREQTVVRDLNLLNNIVRSALRQGLVRSNPIGLVERPRFEQHEWVTMTPAEVASVERAFREMIEAARDEKLRWLEQARVVFILVATMGLRRGEVLGLHWRDIDLADPDGAVLKVRETWVRSGHDTPKSVAGRRTIPLGPRLAEELWQHRRRTAFQGDDERVFGSPTKGSPMDAGRYAVTLRLALEAGGVARKLRPFHDGRHTAITSDAISGSSAVSLMTRAGHSDFRTTQRYINAAGVSFRDEAVRAEERILGSIPVQESGTNVAVRSATDAISSTDGAPL